MTILGGCGGEDSISAEDLDRAEETLANSESMARMARDVVGQSNVAILRGWVAVARENAEANGVASRVHCAVADLLTPPENFHAADPFDVLTANPPYVAEGDPIAEEVRREPGIALYGGTDGLDFLRPILRDAPKFLAPGGALIVEFGCGQADALRDLVVGTGRFTEPKILRDHQEIERAAVCVRR